jgi:outer membrane protein TolC
VRRILIVLLTACLVSLSVAPPQAAPQAALANEENGLRLSLAECLQRALENNLALVIARKDPKIAEVGIQTEKAPFDPVLQASGTYSHNRQDQQEDQTITYLDPPNESVSGSNTASPTDKPLRGDLSFGQLLKFGGSYSVNFIYSQSNPSASLVTLGPGLTYQAESKSRNFVPTLSFTQPLLKGFGTEVNTFSLVLKESNFAISKETLKLRAQTTIQQVENAYWDLLAARAAQNVARESLKLAQDLYDLNKKKVEVGTLAPIEITQAEAGVASREEGVIVADTTVQNAEDNLRMLMAIPKDDPAWSRTILPTDRPKYETQSVDVEATLAKALEVRPEIQTARRQLQDQGLSERVARKNVKHSLDLTATVVPLGKNEQYYTSPARDQITDRPFVRQTDTYNESFDWSVKLLYGVPIFNRAAKANYEIATLNREQAEIGLKNTEQTIRVDVRTAARNVESGVKRVEAARSNSVLQRKTVEAEQKKFENGMSTSFEVLRIQNDLFSAQLAEIQAILSYTKSLADLERAQGTLLEARGLSLDPKTGN